MKKPLVSIALTVSTLLFTSCTQQEQPFESKAPISASRAALLAEPSSAVEIKAGWAIVSLQGTKSFRSVQEAFDAGYNKIRIENGIYEIPGTIKIDRHNVIIRGTSAEGTILRKTGAGSLFLMIGADSSLVENITFDAQTNDSPSSPIWEALGIFSSSNVIVRNNTILGSPRMFALYFAGRHTIPAGQATLDAYENGEMDSCNSARGNVIKSNFPGDVLSFSLQKKSILADNTIDGGLIAFFMNRSSRCVRNTVINSNSAGIFLSIPADSNSISNNIIRNVQTSGIMVARQIDHCTNGASGEILTPHSYRSTGNVIANNTIETTRFMGIVIDQLDSCRIANNTISDVDYCGILTMRSSRLDIRNNQVTNPGQCAVREPIHGFDREQGSGVYGDYMTMNSTIRNTTVTYTDSTTGRFGVKISNWPENSGNAVYNTVVSGKLKYEAVSVPAGTIVKNKPVQ